MINKNKKILFVHQNFPAQYKHVAWTLSRQGYEVHTLSIQKFEDDLTTNHHYTINESTSENIHELAIEFETKMIRASAASEKAIEIKNDGFYPDIIIGHPGWGETFFLKEIWPLTKIISYAEFYYKTSNCDIDFDIDLIENILKKDFNDFHDYNKFKLTSRNAAFSHLYLTSDYLVCPTQFQKNLLPDLIQPNVRVIHDGIDTDILKPNNSVTLKIRDKQFTKSDEIITYVSRSLDPYRGFHTFVKSIPRILKENPKANIIIVGNADTPGYGASPPDGKLYKEIFYSPIEDQIDRDRVFFVGHIPYEHFVKIVQLSTIHVYLTYPFVLSWSLLEAMSCGALIIGSKTDPVTEVITNNENGLLIDFFDSEELSKRVTDVLKNSNKYNKLRENARKTILSDYDLRSVCLPKHLKLIEEALK